MLFSFTNIVLNYFIGTCMHFKFEEQKHNVKIIKFSDNSLPTRIMCIFKSQNTEVFVNTVLRNTACKIKGTNF